MNDSMGEYVASRLIKLMLKKRIHVQQSNILIMGLTFKENCPDIRNTRVVDIVDELKTYDANIHIYDPWVNPDEVKREYGIQIITTLEENKFDAIVLTVAHDHFKKMDITQIRALGKSNSIIYDLKYLFPAELTDERL